MGRPAAWLGMMTTFSRIQAVLFDVDGTLLDTTAFIYGGFDHTLAAHGHGRRGGRPTRA